MKGKENKIYNTKQNVFLFLVKTVIGITQVSLISTQ